MSNPTTDPNFSDDQIIDLVQEMFDDEDIALQRERNDNGPDRYSCPSCGEDMTIKGHAWGKLSLTELPNHKADCKAMKLLAALRARHARRTQ